jgi:hypothetical protein
MTATTLRDSFNSYRLSKEHNMIVRSVSLDLDDVDALRRATSAFPGISQHLAHLAVLRLGLNVAHTTPALLGAELRSIADQRSRRAKEKRRGSLASIKGGNRG